MLANKPGPVSAEFLAELGRQELARRERDGVNIDAAHDRQPPSILREAERIVFGGRSELYGTPERNLEQIAAGWSVILGMTVEPYQVALCMDWLKTCRLLQKPEHRDSWVDKAGYTALGHEVAPLGATT